MEKIIKMVKNLFVFLLFMFVGLFVGFKFLKALTPDLQTVNDGEILNETVINNIVNKVNQTITQQNASNVPVGTIIAWHKSMNGTPTLPSGYVECNGQVLNDASSVYNGATIPDLNNTVSGYNGGRFLRGGTTSGVMQEGTSVRQSDRFYAGSMSLNNDGTYDPGCKEHYNTRMQTAGACNAQTYARVRPLNMSVVYIMKVK